MAKHYKIKKSRAKHVSQDDKDQGTKAPKEDQIEGSKDNEPGSASGSSKKMIKFSKQTERSIKTIVEEHNSKVAEKSMATWRRLGLATAKRSYEEALVLTLQVIDLE